MEHLNLEMSRVTFILLIAISSINQVHACTSVIGTSIESMLEHAYFSVVVVLGLLTTLFYPYCLCHVSYASSQRQWGLEI